MQNTASGFAQGYNRGSTEKIADENKGFYLNLLYPWEKHASE